MADSDYEKIRARMFMQPSGDERTRPASDPEILERLDTANPDLFAARTSSGWGVVDRAGVWRIPDRYAEIGEVRHITIDFESIVITLHNEDRWVAAVRQEAGGLWGGIKLESRPGEEVSRFVFETEAALFDCLTGDCSGNQEPPHDTEEEQEMSMKEKEYRTEYSRPTYDRDFYDRVSKRMKEKKESPKEYSRSMEDEDYCSMSCSSESSEDYDEGSVPEECKKDVSERARLTEEFWRRYGEQKYEEMNVFGLTPFRFVAASVALVTAIFMMKSLFSDVSMTNDKVSVKKVLRKAVMDVKKDRSLYPLENLGNTPDGKYWNFDMKRDDSGVLYGKGFVMSFASPSESAIREVCDENGLRCSFSAGGPAGLNRTAAVMSVKMVVPDEWLESPVAVRPDSPLIDMAEMHNSPPVQAVPVVPAAPVALAPSSMPKAKEGKTVSLELIDAFVALGKHEGKTSVAERWVSAKIEFVAFAGKGSAVDEDGASLKVLLPPEKRDALFVACGIRNVKCVSVDGGVRIVAEKSIAGWDVN